MELNKIFLSGLTFLWVCSGNGYSADRQDGKFEPKLFQVTTAETRPNDAVLIRGEYLDKIKSVKVFTLDNENVGNAEPAYVPLPVEDRLPDVNGTNLRTGPLASYKAKAVDLLQQKEQSLKFIVPEDLKNGVFSVEMTDVNNEKAYFYLNVPIVRWALSEDGECAVAGDYLRVQGKNLLRDKDKAHAVLVPLKGGKNVRCKVTDFFDDFSVSVDIPDNTPLGTYYLYYHNGMGGKTAWSEPLRIDVVSKSPDWWGVKVFNVMDYGAVGDGVHNETAAFRAALHAAGQNGGGKVYVPRGRYMLTGELILSPNTLIEGESKELTHIFWNPLNWDLYELPNSLISGTHHFGLRNLVMWSSRAWGVIMSTGPVEEQGTILLENLIVRQTGQLSGMIYQVKSNRDQVEAEFHSRWSKTGIILRGKNLKVRNCVFNSAGMYTFYAAGGFVQNCRFERHTTGTNQPYMLVHPKGLIFEDCYKQGDGFGYASSIDESRNLYEARNYIPFDYTNDRECMTLDGGSGGYYGPIKSVEGNIITIPEDAETNQWTENHWNGGGVYIINGTGAGQFRRIRSHTLTKIELDQPFLVQPDATSEISVTTVRHHLYFINNEAVDVGAYQLYGSVQNCVISGMTMTRCNGIVGRGSLLYRGKQPEWYIDIVNCRLKEGNYSHWFGIDDRGHSGHQSINLIGSGGTGMSIGTVIRRNVLSEYSYIRTSPGANPDAVTDVIIEDNSFDIAKNAILLGGNATNTSGVLIHNNRYNEVDKRLETNVNKDSYLVIDDNL